MRILGIVAIAIFLYVPISVTAQVHPDNAPVDVSVCELVLHRESYNHKKIRLTTLVSHGFEDFSIMDPSCDAWLNIWLEYGGTTRSGTIYCCGVGPERTRPKSLVIENIALPLVADDKFSEFDRLVQRRPDSLVHATVIGTFFSGEKTKFPNGGWRWGGYGHMGCCSLFVIQQVLSVDSQNRKDLDYSANPDQPDLSNQCSSFQMLWPLFPFRRGYALQQAAETGEKSWAFDDAERVAKDALAQQLKKNVSEVGSIATKKKTQGRVVFVARVRGSDYRYMVVVSRPYWLSFYSADPARVAWIVIGMYESECD